VTAYTETICVPVSGPLSGALAGGLSGKIVGSGPGYVLIDVLVALTVNVTQVAQFDPTSVFDSNGNSLGYNVQTANPGDGVPLLDPQGNQTYDSNGNPIYVNPNGDSNLAYQQLTPQQLAAANGQTPVYDGDGNPIGITVQQAAPGGGVPLLDSQGNQTYDANGNPVYVNQFSNSNQAYVQLGQNNSVPVAPTTQVASAQQPTSQAPNVVNYSYSNSSQGQGSNGGNGGTSTSPVGLSAGPYLSMSPGAAAVGSGGASVGPNAGDTGAGSGPIGLSAGPALSMSPGAAAVGSGGAGVGASAGDGGASSEPVGLSVGPALSMNPGGGAGAGSSADNSGLVIQTNPTPSQSYQAGQPLSGGLTGQQTDGNSGYTPGPTNAINPNSTNSPLFGDGSSGAPQITSTYTSPPSGVGAGGGASGAATGGPDITYSPASSAGPTVTTGGGGGGAFGAPQTAAPT
jgi:hypothetical protein